MENDRARRLYGSPWGLNVAEGNVRERVEVEGCVVAPGAKPQLARLQESGLEAGGWGKGSH